MQQVKRDHLGNNKNPKGGNALPVRAQQTGQGVARGKIKGIAERKSVSLPPVLERIWITFKYRAELNKAASACRKFLSSLSRPDFELITAVSLFGPLQHCDDKKFEELFEQTINETIVKFAARKHYDGLNAAKVGLNKNIKGFFDEARQKTYNDAYRIAKQFETALDLRIAGQAITANWKIFVEMPKK